jgi:hypothetical protein
MVMEQSIFNFSESMKIILIILFLFLNVTLNIKAQKNNFSYNLGASASYTSSGLVPFWLRSNQFGSIPLDKGCLSLAGAIRKEYNRSNSGFFDWGISAEGRANIGYKSNFTLIEGYAKLRLSVFEINAGRSKEIMGLCDSSLSSGSFSISGNTLGIPKVQIAVPEFYIVPILNNLFAFKGTYTHGWIGETPISLNGLAINVKTFFHQKSFYSRFGKPEWKLKFYGGFNHQVLWCNEIGEDIALSSVKTYLSIISGKNRIGDSLGSIDMGFEYIFKDIRLLAYHQFIYDGGALYYLANIRDGLSGLSLVNTLFYPKGYRWKKMLFEVFYTKSQGGEPWSVYRNIRSGAEDYYNNWQYMQGWSYHGTGLGNPFISPRTYTKDGLPSSPYQYFINNRVVAFNFGFEGSFNEWNFISKSSYSWNYGTYSSIGSFPETKQFSAYLETNRELKNGLNFGLAGAIDHGKLYYNSFGLLVKISKSFN